jgi:hypothetical protein
MIQVINIEVFFGSQLHYDLYALLAQTTLKEYLWLKIEILY